MILYKSARFRENFIVKIKNQQMKIDQKKEPLFFKPFYIWKLTLLLLIASNTQTSAAMSSQKINLIEKNSSLIEVLKKIRQQCNYEFVYNSETLKSVNPVDVKLNDAHLDEALTEVFKVQPLTYVITNNTVVIKRLPQIKTTAIKEVKTAQEVISGQVKDVKGIPLPGVNVQIKGSSIGTVTDEEGKYRLNGGQGTGVLIFSYVGYNAQEVQVDNKKSINITLIEEASSLNEVVVVGYGTQKKVNLTGAVSTVDFSKEMDNRPITNASQALSGKVSGVWVSQNSGSPGSDGATLRVRGFGTLNDTNPLVLIDGVEGNLNELNPSDIASMTVLKDAASSAIYGSRAANGVVLVTTKRGNYNSAPQLSYNGYYGVQKLGRRFEIIDNSAEFMNIWNKAVQNNGGDPLFPQDVISAFQTGNDLFVYPNTNFFDEVFTVAPIQEHNVSLKGGSEKSNHYLSFNYMNQDGIIKETESQRFGLNLNLNSKINKWLEVGGVVQATRKVTERPYDDINRIMYLMSNGGYPFIAPYTADGRFGASQALYLSGANAGQPIVDTRSPLPDMYNGLTSYANNFIKGSINATVNFSKDLSFKTLYSGQFNNNRVDRYNEMNYAYTNTGIQTSVLDYPSTINNSRTNSERFYWAFFNTLNYNTTINKNHNITAILGTQIEEDQTKTMLSQRSGPPKEGLHEVDAGTFNALANGNTTKWRMESYFGRLNYNFNQKYLFEANLRTDGSSRFSDGNRWGVFPAFSVGWRLSEEPFLKNVNAIQNLKLRASWGRLGNQNINGIAGDYPYIQSITQDYGTSYNFGGALVPGAAITNLVDRSISWETTESTDIGLDFTLFDGKLSVESDYFTKKTTDILVRLPISQILGGVGAPVENVGEMMNKGFEIATNFNSRNGENSLNYRIGANLTYITNQVTKFRGGQSPDQLYLIREGYSYQSLYGFKSIGVFQTNTEAQSYMSNNGYKPAAGDLKYEDVNGDGQLNYLDKQALGNTIPKFTFGLNLGFSYKNWTLDIVTSGAAGVNAFTKSSWTQPLGISGGVITERWKNAWTPENNSNTLPQIKVNDTWNRYESSFWVSNLSYMKIKNIQLSYFLPKNLTSKLKIGSASVYTNFQNLPAFVFGDYEGFDPERNTFDSGGSLYPTPFISSLGINLQF
jgi:TonB-linked SusC/RagA family outer membrane protein